MKRCNVLSEEAKSHLFDIGVEVANGNIEPPRYDWIGEEEIEWIEKGKTFVFDTKNHQSRQ